MKISERIYAVVMGAVIAALSQFPFVLYASDLVIPDSGWIKVLFIAMGPISIVLLCLAVWFYPAHVAKLHGMNERDVRWECAYYLLGSFTLIVGITLIVATSA